MQPLWQLLTEWIDRVGADNLGVILTVLSMSTGGVFVVARVANERWKGWTARRLTARSSDTGDFRPEDVERAVRLYVEPEVTSVDPAGRERDRLGTREPLFAVLDRELRRQDDPPYLLLLSDSGMGKTTALLNLFARERARRKGVRLALLSCRSDTVLQQIEAVENKRRTILLLDALDEDPRAIENHRARIGQLFDAARRFRGVVMTCRSQFFSSDEEITTDTGLARLAVGPGDSNTWPLQKFYLLSLDDSRVRKYLKRRYPIWELRRRRKAWRMLKRIGDLRARPLVLAYVDDLISSEARAQTLVEVYSAIVDMWLERERPFVAKKEELRSFSLALATDLYANRERRGGEQASLVELAELIQEKGIALEQWQFSGRSLITRSASHQYRFAHRSFLEYFWVEALLQGERECLSHALTDQMREFAEERLASMSAERRCGFAACVRRGTSQVPVHSDVLLLLVRRDRHFDPFSTHGPPALDVVQWLIRHRAITHLALAWLDREAFPTDLLVLANWEASDGSGSNGWFILGDGSEPFGFETRAPIPSGSAERVKILNWAEPVLSLLERAGLVGGSVGGSGAETRASPLRLASTLGDHLARDAAEEYQHLSSDRAVALLWSRQSRSEMTRRTGTTNSATREARVELRESVTLRWSVLVVAVTGEEGRARAAKEIESALRVADQQLGRRRR